MTSEDQQPKAPTMNWKAKWFENALMYICSEFNIRCGEHADVIGYAYKHQGCSAISDPLHYAYDDLVWPKQQEHIGVYVEVTLHPETEFDDDNARAEVENFVYCIIGPIEDWLDFALRLRQNGNLSHTGAFVEAAERWTAVPEHAEVFRVYPK